MKCSLMPTQARSRQLRQRLTRQKSRQGLDDGENIEQPLDEVWPFDQAQQAEDAATASPEIEATPGEDMQGEEA